ncbi:MAG: peptide chain release factor N(5)-glutamine methyltransferase [Opitutae bacterium]|nr:peptide chain release factor N(5)-glutamine methyltransferase [Opitutae bacterium]
MLTILDVLQRTTAFFEAKQIENARLNAELLLVHGLGLSTRMDLYMEFDRLLQESELEKVRPLVKRRSIGEPIQYIEGKANFMGVNFMVDSRVLIPRPETEELVDRIGVYFEDKSPQKILELGTGSGVIALSLARMFPKAEIIATDISRDALTVAERNSEDQGLSEQISFIESDWFEGIDGNFDLIVSNPPYLSQEDVDQSHPEVREHEPLDALVSSGANGEDCLLAIMSKAFPFLTKDAILAMETGIDQRKALEATATRLGYQDILHETDLSGRDRFFFARKA